MIVKRERHTVDGNFYGMFYYFDDGKSLYLAHRSGNGSKGYFRDDNTWCLNTATLDTCKDRGIDAVGVIWRSGKRIIYYVTNTEDFFDPPSFIHRKGDKPQRALNREFFRVRMARTKAGLVPAAGVMMGVRLPAK